MRDAECQAPDAATIEAEVRATCLRLKLTDREVRDVIRAHRRAGYRTIAAGMASTFRTVRQIFASRGEG